MRNTSGLVKIYKSIVHGIGFVPLTVTVILAAISIGFTGVPSLQSLDSYASMGGYFEVSTPESAGTILAALLAAVVAMTVFGFSMMMVVVNQASSNYSPKVVETLSSHRSNQYILGVYIGTVVFTLIVMMHVDDKSGPSKIPQAALLLDILLVVYSTLLFVKFINNISNAVRINSIIENIFNKTRQSLKKDKLKRSEYRSSTERWTVHEARHSGYYQLIRVSRLLKVLKGHDVVIRIIPKVGTYYLDSSPLFASDKPLPNDVADEIRDTFVTYSGEVIKDNPMYGVRQLREVAVKGLSPGINDPGVAILCVDYITKLLSIWMEKPEPNGIMDEEGKVRIIENTFSFSEMLELSLVPIKVYSKRDYTMLIALINSVHNLCIADKKARWKDLFTDYVNSIISDAKKNIDNALERSAINNAISKLNSRSYLSLPLLELD